MELVSRTCCKVCPKYSTFIHHPISNSISSPMPSSLSFFPSPLFPIHLKTPKSRILTSPPLNFRTLNSATGNHQMEVEVKLRLPDPLSHQKLTTLLSTFHTKTYHQENIFFDSPNSELTSKLAVLRLRFYDLDSRCIVSLKAKPQISSGISRVEEEEEPIDPSIGRLCVAEPPKLLSVNSSRIVRRVREEYGIGEKGLICLGGFKNVRGVYEWKGLKVEVDETQYDFGTSFEVECESAEPERAKKMLEDLMKSNGISYCDSEVSKFATFISRKLPSTCSRLVPKLS